MKEYKCIRCGYTNNNLNTFKIHLNRSTLCDPKVADVSLDEEREKWMNIRQTLPFKCPCGKNYKCRQGIYIHQKKCEVYISFKNKNDKKDLSQRVEDLEKQLNELKTHGNNTNSHNTNSNNTNINNNTNNTNNRINITIKDFRYVDGQHITGDALVNLIQKIKSPDVYYDIFKQVMELIYFDENHPELHSILWPNIKKNICQIIKNGTVKYEKKDIVSGMAIHETKSTIHDKYDEDPYLYSIMTRQTMNKMDEKYEDDDKIHMKNLKEVTDIAFLNGRSIVEDTWGGAD